MLDLLSTARIAPATVLDVSTQWFYGIRPGSSRVGC